VEYLISKRFLDEIVADVVQEEEIVAVAAVEDGELCRCKSKKKDC